MGYTERDKDNALDVGRAADQNESVDNDIYFYSQVRYFPIALGAPTDALAVGDGQAYFHIPSGLNGANLVYAHAFNVTPSAVGIPTFQVHNLTDGHDMLSTLLTIDAGETGSNTAANAVAINAAEDDVVTNDIIRIDCDVAGDTTRGVVITLGFAMP